MLVPLEVRSLRRRSRNTVRLIHLFAIATLSVISGLMAGAGIGYTVMFGPSYSSGDFIGLPWLTMVPAVVIGISATIAVNHLIGWAFLKVMSRPGGA
jgi:hypothetical protein